MLIPPVCFCSNGFLSVICRYHQMSYRWFDKVFFHVHFVHTTFHFQPSFQPAHTQKKWKRWNDTFGLVHLLLHLPHSEICLRLVSGWACAELKWNENKTKQFSIESAIDKMTHTKTHSIHLKWVLISSIHTLLASFALPFTLRTHEPLFEPSSSSVLCWCSSLLFANYKLLHGNAKLICTFFSLALFWKLESTDLYSDLLILRYGGPTSICIGPIQMNGKCATILLLPEKN